MLANQRCCRASQGKVGDGLPLLLTAQPGGVKIAAHVRQLATAWLAAPAALGAQSSAATASALAVSATAGLQDGAAVAWGALQLLPYAAESSAQAIALCEEVARGAHAAWQRSAAASSAAPAAKAAPGGVAVASASSAVEAADLLLLRGTAAQILSRLLLAYAPARLPAFASEVYEWMAAHPSNFPAVRAAADVFAALKGQADGGQADDAAALLATSKLEALLTLVGPNLLDACQNMRAATLQVGWRRCVFAVRNRRSPAYAILLLLLRSTLVRCVSFYPYPGNGPAG